MWLYENLYDDLKLGLKGNYAHKEKTPYQNLAIYKSQRFGKVLTLDGIIQTTEKDEFIYHEMLAHPPLILHPNPNKVLIIGAGDGGVLREAVKHKVKKIVMVELDERVIEMSKKLLPSISNRAFEDKRVEIVIDDGAKFIRRTKDAFDVVIIDSPDPIGAAKVLFSLKFYSSLNEKMAKNSVLIRQSGSSILQKEELPGNYKTLKRIFPFVAVQLAAIPTYIGGFFTFIIAGKTRAVSFPPPIKTLKNKYSNLKLKTNYYNPEIHLASLQLPNYVRRLINA